jgi:small subunit ribosomal protein S16
MAVRIRLRREGRKKIPMYRIVVADSRSPGGLSLKQDRANHWLDVGALPTDTVRSLLRRAGILKTRHEARVAKKRTGSAVPLAESTGD